jgi:hypothetical protein
MECFKLRAQVDGFILNKTLFIEIFTFKMPSIQCINKFRSGHID